MVCLDVKVTKVAGKPLSFPKPKEMDGVEERWGATTGRRWCIAHPRFGPLSSESASIRAFGFECIRKMLFSILTFFFFFFTLIHLLASVKLSSVWNWLSPDNLLYYHKKNQLKGMRRSDSSTLNQWSSTRGPRPLGRPRRYCRRVIKLKRKQRRAAPVVQWLGQAAHIQRL